MGCSFGLEKHVEKTAPRAPQNWNLSGPNNPEVWQTLIYVCTYGSMKMGRCPVFLEDTSRVPLPNKVYIVVLYNSHSKIYICGSVYFFCEDHVYSEKMGLNLSRVTG